MMKCPDCVGIGPFSHMSKVGGDPLRVIDVVMIQIKNELWYFAFRSTFRVGASLQTQFSQNGLFRCFKHFRTSDFGGMIRIQGWYSQTYR